jgi:hypothetical protein
MILKTSPLTPLRRGEYSRYFLILQSKIKSIKPQQCPSLKRESGRCPQRVTNEFNLFATHYFERYIPKRKRGSRHLKTSPLTPLQRGEYSWHFLILQSKLKSVKPQQCPSLKRESGRCPQKGDKVTRREMSAKNNKQKKRQLSLSFLNTI